MVETTEEIKTLRLEIDKLKRENNKHLHKIEELLQEKNNVIEKLLVEQDENKRLKEKIDISRTNSVDHIQSK